MIDPLRSFPPYLHHSTQWSSISLDNLAWQSWVPPLYQRNKNNMHLHPKPSTRTLCSVPSILALRMASRSPSVQKTVLDLLSKATAQGSIRFWRGRALNPAPAKDPLSSEAPTYIAPRPGSATNISAENL